MTDTFDLTAAIRAHVETLDSGFTVPAEAERLAATIPDGDFAAWAIEHKAAIVAERMGHFLRSYRSSARQQSPRGAFASAAERLASGETPADVFAATFVVDGDLTRKRLSDLTADDCRYIAADYEATANEAAMEAAFFRALAKKVGRRTVADVMDEDTYLALRASLVTTRAAA